MRTRQSHEYVGILAVVCVSALCKLQLVYYWYIIGAVWVGMYVYNYPIFVLHHDRKTIYMRLCLTSCPSKQSIVIYAFTQRMFSTLRLITKPWTDAKSKMHTFNFLIRFFVLNAQPSLYLSCYFVFNIRTTN